MYNKEEDRDKFKIYEPWEMDRINMNDNTGDNIINNSDTEFQAIIFNGRGNRPNDDGKDNRESMILKLQCNGEGDRELYKIRGGAKDRGIEAIRSRQ